jgi:hypothetical protein
VTTSWKYRVVGVAGTMADRINVGDEIVDEVTTDPGRGEHRQYDLLNLDTGTVDGHMVAEAVERFEPALAGADHSPG